MQKDIAIIKVNNIEVGSMPLLQYKEIVESIKKDWRTRVSSVFSYIGFVWKISNRIWSYYVQSFVVLTALFMIYSLFNTVEITQFVTELRNSSSKQIVEYMRLITNICMFIAIIGCVLSFFIKGYPIFVSASENAINKKIREIMEVPAEGQVSITFKKGDIDGSR